MAASKIKTILKADNISLSYGDKPILTDFSIKLKNMERLAILGQSAVGKSTLLKCLAALEQPSDGSINLLDLCYLKNGKFIVPPYQIRREIGLVFQHFNLFPNLTVLRNITLPLEKALGHPRKEAEIIAKNIIKTLKIDEISNKYPGQISGGQAQRVALSRALVLNPTILLLDEATSAVDPETSMEMMDAIAKLWNFETQQENKPFGLIMVTHDYEFAKRFADRILFLDEGEIVEDHPAEYFESKISNSTVMRYMDAVFRKKTIIS